MFIRLKGSGIIAHLRKLWALPEASGLDLDDPATTQLRVRLIQSKEFLRRIYCEWYGICKDASYRVPQGLHVEVGSGPSFLKKFIGNVISSDIVAVRNVDVVLSGEAMPFGDGTVAAFYLTDALHHIPRPRRFLAETARCLKPGGRIVMIEPYNTVWGRWVWQNLHHESFDVNAGWGFISSGPLSGGNGALPWIIFERDRELFERGFPLLRVIERRPFMPFSYLLAGGISMRPLLNGSIYPLCRGIEKLLGPLNKILGMFAVIQLLRVEEGQQSGNFYPN